MIEKLPSRRRSLLPFLIAAITLGASASCIQANYYTANLLLDVTLGTAKDCGAAQIDQLVVTSLSNQFPKQTVQCVPQVVISPINVGTSYIEVQGLRLGEVVYVGAAEITIPTGGAEVAVTVNQVAEFTPPGGGDGGSSD